MNMSGESREAEQQYLDRLRRQSGHVRIELRSRAAVSREAEETMDMSGESREAEQQYLDRLRRQSGHVRRERGS